MVPLLLGLAACQSEGDEPPPRGQDERTIVVIQSYVYASQTDTSVAITGRIRDQIRSAFGALKSLRVTGSNRELSNDASNLLYREPLVMVSPGGRETVVSRVWFRYSDEVIAPSSVPRGAPMLVGGLHRQEEALFERIVIACTANTNREREYKGRLQAVFDGSLSTCQDAILAEEAVIAAARVVLDAPEDETVPEEFGRVFVPVVARLLERNAKQMGNYPRFEAVVPQAGRVAAASSPVTGRAAAGSDDAASSPFTEAVLGGETPGVAREEPRPDKPTPIVIPNAGVATPDRPAGARAEDEPASPNAAPELPIGSPVVVAEGSKGPASPVQPRNLDGAGGFEWEDLLDKRFLALWIAIFALYPLLRRRSEGS